VKENDMNGDSAGWTEDVFPNLTDEAKRLILRMTNLDPTKRATMSEIVEDSYWVEVEKSSVTYGTSERV
jgi:serine/threonine protein kinase